MPAWERGGAAGGGQEKGKRKAAPSFCCSGDQPRSSESERGRGRGEAAGSRHRAEGPGGAGRGRRPPPNPFYFYFFIYFFFLGLGASRRGRRLAPEVSPLRPELRARAVPALRGREGTGGWGAKRGAQQGLPHPRPLPLPHPGAGPWRGCGLRPRAGGGWRRRGDRRWRWSRGSRAARAPHPAPSVGAGPGSPGWSSPRSPLPAPGSSRACLNSLRLDLAISSLNRVTIEPQWDPNKEFESS